MLASAEDAAGLFGFSAGHPFVYLARMLQSACHEIEQCTSTDVLLTVTASQAGVPGGVLLFASGFLGRASAIRPSPQVEAQLAVGVDRIVTAVRQVALENKKRAADVVDGDADAPNKDAAANGPVTRADGLAAGTTRRGPNGEEPERIGDDGSGSACGTGEDQGAPADDGCGDVGDLTGQSGLSDEGSATPGVNVERTSEQPTRPPDRPSPAPENPPGNNNVAESVPRASGNVADRTGSSAHGLISDYVLPSTFVVPGLTVAPARIQLPSTRGGVRFVPPEPAVEEVDIPDSTVHETIKQLSVPTRDDSLRTRLVEFTSLYKYVIDHLVKRSCVDPEARDKVNHPYLDVTPDVVRGKKVSFLFTKSKRVSVLSPTFRNSRATKSSSSLAVILLMKRRGDPFFLWLLGLFSGGAVAPVDYALAQKGGQGSDAEGNAPAAPASRSKCKKRARESPRKGSRSGLESNDLSTSAAAASSSRNQSVVSGEPPEAKGAVAPPDVPSQTTANDDAAALISAGSARVQAACQLLSDGKVIGTGTVHPEFDLFHSLPARPSIVTVFLRQVVPGCGDIIYPFGQDAQLCLERGNPSSVAVPLSSIPSGYRIAWPVADVGYVLSTSAAVCVFQRAAPGA